MSAGKTVQADTNQCVNHRKTTHSLLLLVASGGSFPDGVDVTGQIQDKAHGYFWDAHASKLYSDKQHLAIKMKCADKTARKKVKSDGDTGMLSVTLTDGTSTDVGPVTYVDDTEL